jgi:hypothetical protein
MCMMTASRFSRVIVSWRISGSSLCSWKSIIIGIRHPTFASSSSSPAQLSWRMSMPSMKPRAQNRRAVQIWTRLLVWELVAVLVIGIINPIEAFGMGVGPAVLISRSPVHRWAENDILVNLSGRIESPHEHSFSRVGICDVKHETGVMPYLGIESRGIVNASNQVHSDCIETLERFCLYSFFQILWANNYRPLLCRFLAWEQEPPIIAVFVLRLYHDSAKFVPHLNRIVDTENCKFNPQADVFCYGVPNVCHRDIEHQNATSFIENNWRTRRNINCDPWTMFQFKLALRQFRLPHSLPSQFLCVFPRFSSIFGLLIHRIGLTLDGPKSHPSNQNVNCRDVYDDPFRSEKPWQRFLFVCLLSVLGFSVAMFSGGRWIDNHMRWWHWLLALCGLLMCCIGLTLLIFGHAWTPNQECSTNSEYRQTFQHDAENVTQVSVLGMRDGENIAGMEVLRQQWDDIRGNFKWQIIVAIFGLLGGNALLSAFVAWIAKVFQRMIGLPVLPARFYVVLAILVFCVIVLSAIFLLVFTAFMAKRNPSKLSPEPQTCMPPEEEGAYLPAVPNPPVVPEPPKAVDLKGEFLELYFYRPDVFNLVVQRVYVLMKMRIVNCGPDEATITSWQLGVQLDDGFQLDGSLVSIPPLWRIKRRKEGFLNLVYFEDSMDVCLSALPHSETYRKGVPRVGWVAFECCLFENVEFPNAQFDLRIDDSLSGRHCIQKMPSIYRRMGEVVVASDPPISDQPVRT